jgi:hypothetical protein
MTDNSAKEDIEVITESSSSSNLLLTILICLCLGYGLVLAFHFMIQECNKEVDSSEDESDCFMIVKRDSSSVPAGNSYSYIQKSDSY